MVLGQRLIEWDAVAAADADQRCYLRVVRADRVGSEAEAVDEADDGLTRAEPNCWLCTTDTDSRGKKVESADERQLSTMAAGWRSSVRDRKSASLLVAPGMCVALM